MMKNLFQLSLMLLLSVFMLTAIGQNSPMGLSVSKNGEQYKLDNKQKIIPQIIEKEMVQDLFPTENISKQLQKPGNSKAIVFEEDFTGIVNWELPTGWSVFSPYAMNYVYVYDEEMTFFRQSDDEEMICATSEIDFTDATTLTFELYTAPQTTNIPQFEVGIMTDPNDPLTFEVLDIILMDVPFEIISCTTYVTSITGTYHLAFREYGLAWDMVKLDNIVLTDDLEDADWPQNVSDINAVAGAEGANYAMVSWTNPSLEADGDPLTELSSITVEASGTVFYTLSNPEIGGEVEAQIEVDTAGLYTFEVIAHNSAGSSNPVPASEIWVGLDTPGPIYDFVLTETNENICNLTWSAPTEGTHGAWFDGVIDEYILVRSDGIAYVLDGGATSFQTTLEIPGTYNFTITPVNFSGDGTPTISNTAAFYFNGYLLWEDFFISIPAFEWSIQGEGQEGTWFQSYWNTFETFPEMIFLPYYTSFTGVSSMVSPVINSTSYEALALSFDHKHEPNSSYTFKVITTSDNGATWNEAFVLEVNEPLPPAGQIVIIDTDDVGSENFQFAFSFEGNTASVSKFLIDNVRLSEPVEVDMIAVDMFIPDLINPLDVISPSGDIDNAGYMEVEYTATMIFTYEGTEVYNSEVIGLIGGGESLEIEFDDWTAIEGEYDVELIVSADGDVNPDNNVITDNFVVYVTIAERTLVVCEEATGTWCGYCPGAAMGLDDLTENGWPVAIIAYHSGDNYETTEGGARLNFYLVGGYPTVYFDGIESVVGGSATQTMYGAYLPVVQGRLNIPAPVSIEIFDMALTGSTLTADIQIDSDSPINNDNLKLFAAITESHIPEAWQNQSEINFVERAMFNGEFGTPLDLSNNSETISVNFELDETWNAEHCELIVFVQDTQTREVYNGNKQFLSTIIGTQEQMLNPTQLYPNPARDLVTLNAENTIESVTIYNFAGQLVLTESVNNTRYRVNTSNFNSGIYLFQIETLEGTIAKRVIIE